MTHLTARPYVTSAPDPAALPASMHWAKRQTEAARTAYDVPGVLTGYLAQARIFLLRGQHLQAEALLRDRLAEFMAAKYPAQRKEALLLMAMVHDARPAGESTAAMYRRAAEKLGG